MNGTEALLSLLRSYNIDNFSGVTGGGVLYICNELAPIHCLHDVSKLSGILSTSGLFTIAEYVAGYVPLGYYLASGKVGGCVLTTGAATRLAWSGLSDARSHNIPALYIIALNTTYSHGKAPLQDVSQFGMNIVPQLQAEFGDDVFILDDRQALQSTISQVAAVLAQSRPVALCFRPDILGLTGPTSQSLSTNNNKKKRLVIKLTYLIHSILAD